MKPYILFLLASIAVIVAFFLMYKPSSPKKELTLVETICLNIKEHPKDWQLKQGNWLSLNQDTLQNEKCKITLIDYYPGMYLVSPDSVFLNLDQADSIKKAYYEFILKPIELLEKEKEKKKIKSLIKQIQNCNNSQ